jgi:tetratricopeptide (TPR) repeat protein
MSDYDYSDDGGEINYGSDANMDEGGEDDLKIQLENTFYEAEDAKNSDPARSLSLFEQVVNLSKETGEKDVRWQWKALEQVVLLRAKLGKEPATIVAAFSELLSHMNKVTPNEVNDTINNILDALSGLSQQTNLDAMYEMALEKLKSSNHERLWFNANLKRGKAFLARGEYDRLEQVVRDLRESNSANDDVNKGTYLLEVYALEIAMYGAKRDTKRLREAYSKTQALSAAIQDPRIMGGIHETGGKMFMEEGRWQEAYDEFYAGFRHMQEAGDVRAKQCLKLVVLANMLAVSSINPFDSREARVYQNDEEIKCMLALRTAFETSDIKEFERVLKDPKAGISNDPFISRFTASLLRNIRSATLQRIVKPYNRIRLAFLGKEIGVDADEVEELLVQLILDGKVEARIDQQQGLLDLSGGSRATSSTRKYAALESWTKSTQNVSTDLNAGVHAIFLKENKGLIDDMNV